MPINCLVVSKRSEDLIFGKQLADLHQMVCINAPTVHEVSTALIENPRSIVLWDVDYQNVFHSSVPGHVAQMSQTLANFVPPDQVFAISDEHLSSKPHLFSNRAFNHHIIRKFDETAAEVIGRIGLSCLSPDPFGMPLYLPSGTQVQNIQIIQAKQRAPAVEAVRNVFVKRGIPVRLAAAVAQATDELLMNAIFDAPVTEAGDAYRRQTDRTTDFALTGKEAILLQVASTPKYIAIAVTDQFGSIKKDAVLRFIQNDYEKRQYTVKDDKIGAGLGIYGILRAGLSLHFVAAEKKKTQVMLFFPVLDNFKAFRNCFKFFSFHMK